MVFVISQTQKAEIREMVGPRTGRALSRPRVCPRAHEPSCQILGGAPGEKSHHRTDRNLYRKSNLTTTKRKHRITLHKTIINDPVTTDARQEEEQ